MKGGLNIVFRAEDQEKNHQYEKDAREIIANAGINETFKLNKNWLWWMPECGYTQFYLNKIQNPEISTYQKLVDIDLKLGIDYTQHLYVAIRMFGRKMKFEEVRHDIKKPRIDGF